MNILFLTLVKLKNLNDTMVYTDMLHAFAENGKKVVFAYYPDLIRQIKSSISTGGLESTVDILKEAEQNIKQQVDALNGLENRIINAVEEGNDGLSSKISEVQNKIEPFVRENLRTVNYSAQTNQDLINVSFNSVLGNALLYICLRSIETNKSWPIDILGNEMKLYFQGYLVAMASVSTLQFHYETENDFQIIKSCSFGDSFNVMEYKTKIIDDIKQKIGDEQSSKLLKTIEDYFS